MRIALLIDTGEWGGAEGHTVTLAHRLQARGHDVTIALLNDQLLPQFREATESGVSVLSLAPVPGSVRAWRSRLRALGADVGVFAKNWLHAGSVSLEVAARLAFRTYVVIEHLTPPPPPAPSRTRYRYGIIPSFGWWRHRERGLIRLRGWCPHRLFTVSHAVKTALVRDYGYPASRMVTIHNGIDGTRFVPSAAARAASRERWGVPADATVFGTVGRLAIAHKGLDLAIDAFSQVASARPSEALWLVIVGQGPDGEALRRQAQATTVSSRILFAGHTAEPWEVYPAIDFLLMPSRFEGLPFSLMEAMSSGCCPIAAAVSGIPEIVATPEYGWLVDAEDVQGLAAAMTEARTWTSDERSAAARRCRERILSRFSSIAQFDHLADAIERTHVRRPLQEP